MAQDSPNRREFLKAAGAAPSLFARNIFASKIGGANEKVNVAFIGVGRMGSRNMAYAARVAGFRIAAVCDVCRPALERARAQSRRLGFYGVKAREDFREILADPSVDAVCIAAPDQWRPYIMVEACKAGKDVYVETPAFAHIEEGPRMVEAARKYRRVVQAGAVQRSGAALQRAREIVKSGGLGDIAFCRGFFHPGWGHGLHPIDTVQFAFDEAMPVSVTAQATPDMMLVTYRYPGFICSYESRRAGPRTPYCGTSFHGDKATIVVSCEEAAGMNAAHWKNFLECIKTRVRPVGDIETCVRTTATCVLASLAIRHNATLDWDDRAFAVKQNKMKLAMVGSAK